MRTADKATGTSLQTDTVAKVIEKTTQNYSTAGEKTEITAADANNWKVGKHHYYQTLPKAMLSIGIKDEKLLKAYNESFEAFKRKNAIEITSSGEYKIEREYGTPLFSRNKERLYLLAFETLLKRHSKDLASVPEALKNIDNGIPPIVKSFGGAR